MPGRVEKIRQVLEGRPRPRSVVPAGLTPTATDNPQLKLRAIIGMSRSGLVCSAVRFTARSNAGLLFSIVPSEQNAATAARGDARTTGQPKSFDDRFLSE